MSVDLNIKIDKPVKPPTFIVYDRNTKEIVRVVQCDPLMVTMSGMWSNQFEVLCWDDILVHLQNLKAQMTQNYDHGQGD